MQILLVEDDVDDSDLFCEMVNEIDPSVQVVVATDPEKAIRALSVGQLQPDYGVLDINIPGMNGIECLRALRLDLRATFGITIYSTALSQIHREECTEFDAHCLEKPRTYDDWRQAVSTVIATARKSITT